MKTLYLHIGTPKTATTTLQEFCYINQSVLESKGYCYPMFQMRFAMKARKRNALFLEAKMLDDNGKQLVEEEAEFRRECLNRIRELFEIYDNVILSDESIWEVFPRRKKNMWADLHQEARDAGYQIRIVVYLRRQDDYISSWWNQRIKKGMLVYATTPWDTFIKKNVNFINPDYYKSLEVIAEEFGLENILVRRFDRGSFIGGTIEEDFLTTIGLELTDEFLPVEAEQNQRLSGNLCEIKRIINGMEGITWEENRFLWDLLLEQAPVSMAEYPADVFSREEAMEFMKRFEEDNEKLAEKYIGDGKPLFSTDFKDREKWQKENPHMEADLIRYMTANSLAHVRKEAQLMDEIKELRLEIQQLRLAQDKMRDEMREADKKIEKTLQSLKHTLKHPLRSLIWAIRHKVMKS